MPSNNNKLEKKGCVNWGNKFCADTSPIAATDVRPILEYLIFEFEVGNFQKSSADQWGKILENKGLQESNQ